MRIFTYLFLWLINFTDTKSTSCLIPQSEIWISFVAGLNLTTVKNDLIQTPADEYFHTICLIEIRVNYQDHSIQIMFNIMDEHMPGEVSDLITVFNFDNEVRAFVTNSLSYACSSTNHCHYDFLLKNLQWLIEENYFNLITHLRPLLSSDHQTRSTVLFANYRHRSMLHWIRSTGSKMFNWSLLPISYKSTGKIRSQM